MADSLRIRLNRSREKHLERAIEALGGDVSKAEAVELALQHLHQSANNYDRAKEELTPAQAKLISTDVVRLTHYAQVRTGRE